MFDPISIAVGGGLVIAGYVTGRIGRRKRVEPAPPKAICGCKHSLAMHDPQTNECHERVRVPNVGYDNPCKCRQYTGPRPVESLFTTPTLPPQD